MKNQKQASPKAYFITALIACVLLAVMLWVEGLFDGAGNTPAHLFRILSDAFLIPGALLLIIGGAVGVYQLGAFDGAVYFVKQFSTALDRSKQKSHHIQTFAEFVERRDAADKVPVGHFLWVGGCMFVLSVLFLILIYLV